MISKEKKNCCCKVYKIMIIKYVNHKRNKNKKFNKICFLIFTKKNQ